MYTLATVVLSIDQQQGWEIPQGSQKTSISRIHRLDPGLIVGLGGHLVWVLLVAPFSSNPTVLKQRGAGTSYWPMPQKVLSLLLV